MFYMCGIQMARMHSPRSLFYLAVMDGTLIAVSGWIRPEAVTKSVERYYPAEDRWEMLNSLSLGLHEHAGKGLNYTAYEV